MILPGSKFCYIVVLTADISAFLTGASLAWSSPIIALLESDDISNNPLGRVITTEEESWIGSLSPMGSIFAPPLFGFLTQTIGRKNANLLVVVPFLASFLTASFAQTIPLLYVARILMGVGIGGVFTILPIYIVEVSERVNRGLLSGSITTSIMAGMLFTYSIGPYVSIMNFNLILSILCVCYFPTFWYIASETPIFLASKKKYELALKSLHYLRRTSLTNLEKELEEIKHYLDGLQEGSFKDIFTNRGNIKALVYSITLTTLQQFSGINVILAFTQNIFQETGTDIPPAICSIIVAFMQFVSSFGTPLGVEKFGRRPLLLVSLVGATLAQILLGSYFYWKPNLDWLPLFSLVVFIIFYNLGMGALPWVIMAEILPSSIISKAAAITTSVYWVTGFFLTKYFGALSDGVGMAGSFWLFAGFCLIDILFILLFMFETKGKTLQEIQEFLNK